MKRQARPRASISRLAVVSLVAATILSNACQNSDANVYNSAPSPTANANTAGATTQSNQANAHVLSVSHQPADNAGNTGTAGPSIQITVVPSKGAGANSMERITGRVGGVNIDGCKVVLFARTDKWYVEPYISSPDTRINDDGTWENDTYLGSEYAALLVRAAYKPPSTTVTLPNVGGLVLAIAKATPEQ